uniref:CUB-like domain-containing protein n=1 Tax=Panagrolaimus davidi TaxID=227884 RepID=A0A914QEV3_9BILA
MQKAHSKNCKNTNNVFAIIFPYQDFITTVSGAANGNGSCEIILLALTGFRGLYPAIYPAISLETIQTSSAFKVTSPFNQKTIIEINSTDADSWQSIKLYALALTFVIPPSQNITVKCAREDTPVNIHIPNGESNGVFASPNYGGYDIYGTYELYYLYDNWHYPFCCNNYTIKLNVKHMDGNGTAIFYNRDQRTSVRLQQNQTVTQYGGNFILYYNSSDSFTFLVEYKVKEIIIPTTTPKPSPIPTPANVTLHSANPYYIFWLNNLAGYGYLTVCTESDDVLELFVSTGYELDKFNLYDYSGLYDYRGTLSNFTVSSEKTPKSITSKSNCFTIVPNYNNTNALTTLLFRRKNQQRQYCFGNNIFQAPSSSSSNVTCGVSVVQGYDEPICEAIFLASPSEMPIIRIGEVFGSSRGITLLNGISSITKDKNSYQRGILVSPNYSGFYAKLNGSNEMYQLTNHETTGTKTVASSNKIITLSDASPTYFYWLGDLNFHEMLTVCSPNYDKLQMFVAFNPDTNPESYVLYDAHNYIGTIRYRMLLMPINHLFFWILRFYLNP